MIAVFIYFSKIKFSTKIFSSQTPLFHSRRHQVTEANCLAYAINDFKAKHRSDLASIYIGISFNVTMAQASTKYSKS